MKYSVECNCGRTLPVEATQAGSTLVCTGCNQAVPVPRLSKLRVAAGETAIPLNAAERVRQAVHNGTLPSNSVCPVTGGVADSTAVFLVRCESSWRKGGQTSTAQLIVFWLFLGWIGVLIAMLRNRETEIHGRETVVTAPLRVSTAGLLQLSRGWSQSALRALLASVPQYAELFHEYPSAEISFDSASNHK
jgi:hypothetical protein